MMNFENVPSRRPGLQKGAKSLLRNMIRHTDTHNRLLEEAEMWQIHDKMNGKQHQGSTQSSEDEHSSAVRSRREMSDQHSGRDDKNKRERGGMESSFLYDDRRAMDNNERYGRRLMKRAHMDDENDGFSSSRGSSTSTFWQRQLLKAEEDDADRWGHGGFRELYPADFESDHSDKQTDSNRHGKHKLGKKKKTKGTSSSRKRKKEKKKKKKKRKKNETDSESEDDDQSFDNKEKNLKPSGKPSFTPFTETDSGNDTKQRRRDSTKQKHNSKEARHIKDTKNEFSRVVVSMHEQKYKAGKKLLKQDERSPSQDKVQTKHRKARKRKWNKEANVRDVSSSSDDESNSDRGIKKYARGVLSNKTSESEPETDPDHRKRRKRKKF